MQAREGHVPGHRRSHIWYQVVGRADTTPIVTVHGGPGATHDYLEPLQALADERPVVFYDQLGAGKSDLPDDISLWTSDLLVDELGRLLDALGLAPVHLFGQSWGTIVAAEYALAQPDRVVSLVLSDPCLSMPRYAAANARHPASDLGQSRPPAMTRVFWDTARRLSTVHGSPTLYGDRWHPRLA